MGMSRSGAIVREQGGSWVYSASGLSAVWVPNTTCKPPEPTKSNTPVTKTKHKLEMHKAKGPDAKAKKVP